MSAVRQIVGSGSAARVIASATALFVAAAAIESVTMSIINISGRANEDLLFAVRVTRWIQLYENPRFHLQVRRGSGGPLIYEWSTGGGPSSPGSVIWLEQAGAETVLMCKMPAADALALGPIRAVHDLRVEDADSDAYRVVGGGILNLVGGVTI